MSSSAITTDGKRGQLAMRGKNRDDWKVLWFELKGQSLAIFAARGKPSALLTIDLRGSNVQACREPRRPFCFSLSTRNTGTVHMFSAESEMDRDDWMDQIITLNGQESRHHEKKKSTGTELGAAVAASRHEKQKSTGSELPAVISRSSSTDKKPSYGAIDKSNKQGSYDQKRGKSPSNPKKAGSHSGKSTQRSTEESSSAEGSHGVLQLYEKHKARLLKGGIEKEEFCRNSEVIMRVLAFEKGEEKFIKTLDDESEGATSDSESDTSMSAAPPPVHIVDDTGDSHSSFTTDPHSSEFVDAQDDTRLVASADTVPVSRHGGVVHVSPRLNQSAPRILVQDETEVERVERVRLNQTAPQLPTATPASALPVLDEDVPKPSPLLLRAIHQGVPLKPATTVEKRDIEVIAVGRAATEGSSRKPEKKMRPLSTILPGFKDKEAKEALNRSSATTPTGSTTRSKNFIQRRDSIKYMERHQTLDELCSKQDPTEKYKKMTKIGEGSFGLVFSAVSTANKGKVAIKKMVVTKKNKVHLETELQLHKSCSGHPNVVPILDAYIVEDRAAKKTEVWVILEFLQYGALTEALTQLEMKEPDIAYVCKETMAALSWLHSRNRIHRDIKSDNVLLGENGEVKLADFGLAIQLTKQQEKRRSILGTPYWMSPEIINGKDYDDRVDVWALGIMTIEMMEKHPPYINYPKTKALFLITSQGIPLTHFEKDPRWSKDMKDWLAQCLLYDAIKRPTVWKLADHPFLARSSTKEQFVKNVVSKLGPALKQCRTQ